MIKLSNDSFITDILGIHYFRKVLYQFLKKKGGFVREDTWGNNSNCIGSGKGQQVLGSVAPNFGSPQTTLF